jgi:hypothetical protein
LVTLHDMAKKRKKVIRKKGKRFTVSLTDKDYTKLKKIADKQEPPCSLTFVVNRALQIVFGRADNPQRLMDFAHPLQRDRS